MDLIKAIWGQNISMNLLKYSNLSCKMVLGLKVTDAVALMLKVTVNTNHWYNVQKKMLYNTNANAEAKTDDWR